MPVAAVTVVSYLFYEKLPTLAAEKRRILMVPCVLVCAGIFNGTMADVFDSVDDFRTAVQRYAREAGRDPQSVGLTLRMAAIGS